MFVNWGIRLFLFLSLLASAFSLVTIPDIRFGDEDTVLTDVNKRLLGSQISNVMRTKHLGISTKEIFETKAKGMIYGRGSRWMINLTTNLDGCNKKRNIIYMLDTTSPVSQLTKDALTLLYEDCGWEYKNPH